jgi:hypothetical protein
MAYEIVTSFVASATPYQKQLIMRLKVVAEAAGWTTIEDAYSDGTYTRYVFRSPDSSFYSTWFYHNTGCTGSTTTGAISTPTNGLGYLVSEGYNVGTHNFIRPAVVGAHY